MGRSVDVPTPEVFEPLLQPARYKGAYGGRAGAKSHFFADQIVERCLLRRGAHVVCIRETQVSLEQSAKRLITNKLASYGLGERDGFRVMNTHIETPGDGRVIFLGMQNHTADSIKSLESYDVAWIEEAQNLSERSLTILRPTMFRTKGSEIWASWNPRSPKDPIDDLFRGNAPRKPGQPAWAAPDGAVVVKTSYKDNPWLQPEILKEIEWDRARDPEKFEHVWLGGYERHAESRVFKNFTVEAFDDDPNAQYFYGADWGYSVDPSTLVRMRVDGKKLFISHEAYRVGCEIEQLPALFDTVPGARDHIVVADSARPETISYMQRHGYPLMRPAKKGKDSVKEGIIFLQGFDVVIHPRCEHAIIEFSTYRYEVDPRTNEVVVPFKLHDKENHIIDPCRYGLEQHMRPEYQSWVVA